MLELVALSSENNTLLIALLIPFLGIVSPLLLAWQLNRNSSSQKKADWKRQDEVAAEALRQQKAVAEEAIRQQKEVAEEARRRQQEVADQVLETARLSQARQDATDLALGRVARLAATTSKDTVKQLVEIKSVADQTHVLVNSSMMREMRKGLVSLRAQRTLLARLVASQPEASTEDQALLTQLDSEIDEQEQALENIVRATEEANQIAKDAHSRLPVDPAKVLVSNPEPVEVTISEQVAKEVIQEIKKQEETEND